MSEQRPPGWYQDPFGTSESDQRYWDGETWQANTPPPTPQVTAQPDAPRPAQMTFQSAPADSNLRQPSTAAYTPDGVRIASWGRRFAAYLVDGFVASIVGVIASLFTNYWEISSELVAQSASLSEAEVVDLVNSYSDQITGAALTISLVMFLFNAVYSIVMTATRGATLGKMVAGIRVRLRDAEGLPSFGTAGVRWLTSGFVAGLAAVGPFGFLYIYTIVDGLWPLRDPNRQAIHDKIAKTNVVVSRG